MPAVKLSKHGMETLVNEVHLWERINSGEFDELPAREPWPGHYDPECTQYIINYYDKTHLKPRYRIVTAHYVKDRNGHIVHRDVEYLVIDSNEYKDPR